MNQVLSLGIGFCINAVVSKHIKTFFGDMDNELFNKLEGRFCDEDRFVVFVTLVPIGDERAVITSNSGLCHGRSADVTGNVFGNSGRRIEVLLVRRIHIEPVRVSSIKVGNELIIIFQGESGRIKLLTKIMQKGGLPSLAQHGERNVMNIFPLGKATDGAFGEKHVDMGIPFEVATESVQTHDHASGELLIAILLKKPVMDNLSRGTKQNIKELTVSTEVRTEFFGNGKNDMAMPAVY